MPKELPKKIYAEWNEDDPDSPFINASDDPKQIAEQDGTKVVGIYELQRKVQIVNATEVCEFETSAKDK